MSTVHKTPHSVDGQAVRPSMIAMLIDAIGMSDPCIRIGDLSRPLPHAHGIVAWCLRGAYQGHIRQWSGGCP